MSGSDSVVFRAGVLKLEFQQGSQVGGGFQLVIHFGADV
jgi:hypothetical protein